MRSTHFDHTIGNPVSYEALRAASPHSGGGGGGGSAGATMRVELEASTTAAAEARAALAALRGRLDGGILEDIRLLVSELVTNSVRHSGADPAARVDLQVTARPRAVRVEVTDSGAGFQPRARTRDQDKGSGWGLHLVERIADRWGVDRQRRTRVWFEIDR
jgi:anti-sigma regulatory factor (Ser/Thr protein kinase)